MQLEVLRLKVSPSKRRIRRRKNKNNKNQEMTDGFHSCSFMSISHKEAPVMQAASKQEHVNNEKKVSVFITGGEIKDNLLLPPAITVALISEALEPSSVGARFQLSVLKAALHLLRHKMKLSLSCYVSVKRPSPAFDWFLNGRPQEFKKCCFQLDFFETHINIYAKFTPIFSHNKLSLFCCTFQ